MDKTSGEGHPAEASRVDVSIVVVNWNTRDLLRQCLHSLDTGPYGSEIILVDNASTDGSVEMIRREFPNVKLVVNRDNVGFIRATNQVLRQTLGARVLLLNPDTIMRKSCIQTLMKYLTDHPQCSAVGPRIVHPMGRLSVLSAGRQPSLASAFNHFLFLSRFSKNIRVLEGLYLIQGIHDDRPRAVEWLTGGCLLVRREVIDEVGLLNERWFMYAEDMEWCDRMRSGGWQLAHVPTAVVEHHVGASAEQNPDVSGMWLRNMRSHFATRTGATSLDLAVFDLILVAGLGLRAVGYLARSLVDSHRRSLWLANAARFGEYAIAPRRWRS